MNLTQALLKEHSKAQRDRIVRYIGNNPVTFTDLVSVFLHGPYRITQRAAWPLSYCVQRNTELIHPHLAKILRFTQQAQAPTAVKRNVARLLQFIDVPKKYQGTVADMCFKLFTDKKESIAVRVFSMTVLVNLAAKIPELKHELIALIEDQLPYSSAAFVSRGVKALKQLKS